MKKQRIQAEADAFFEWPTADKSYVTTISMLEFASRIADMVRREERAACAEICDQQGLEWRDDAAAGDKNYALRCRDLIRAR